MNIYALRTKQSVIKDICSIRVTIDYRGFLTRYNERSACKRAH